MLHILKIIALDTAVWISVFTDYEYIKSYVHDIIVKLVNNGDYLQIYLGNICPNMGPINPQWSNITYEYKVHDADMDLSHYIDHIDVDTPMLHSSDIIDKTMINKIQTSFEDLLINMNPVLNEPAIESITIGGTFILGGQTHFIKVNSSFVDIPINTGMAYSDII